MPFPIAMREGRVHCGWVMGILGWLALAANAAESVGVTTPEGFTITEFSGPDLASDIYSLTLDTQGRIWVASRGYIRVLEDTDRDGRADKAVDFAEGPDFGAMGLHVEEDALYVTGDGALYRYFDRDGDLRADGTPQTLLQLKKGGEHGVHAVRRGPDGWLYVLLGNSSGLNARHVSSRSSPITHPQAGGLIRLAPDLKRLEIVGDGFRNPYDFDFNPAGDVFAYDSDNERCVSLPWYEPTRFYHVAPGNHHGWFGSGDGETWRFPPYFADIAPPVCTLGRGSPTGVVCYRHAQFPAKYRGGFFLLDWTFGRVYFVAAERFGASYQGTPEVFIEAEGGGGFAPTDVEVDPTTGDLFLSVGGRGTRGAVYRVRHNSFDPKTLDQVEIDRLQPAPVDLDGTNNFSVAIALAAADKDTASFRTALEWTTRFVTQFDDEPLSRLVARGLDHPDRWVRAAAARLESRRREISSAHRDDSRLPRSLRVLAHLASAGVSEKEISQRLQQALPAWEKSNDVSDRLSLVRAAQILAGDIGDLAHRTDVWFGYSSASAGMMDSQIVDAIATAFPAGQWEIDREIARLAAMVQFEDAGFNDRLLARITADSDPTEDIHYLIVRARCRGEVSSQATVTIAQALLNIDEKITRLHRQRDRNWAPRLRELHLGLAEQFPGLNDALLTDPAFGKPDHLIWAQAKGMDRKRAAERFLARINSESDYSWSAELVELLAELPRERVVPLLREHWEEVHLRDSIARVLAEVPDAADVARLTAVLSTNDEKTRTQALGALEKLAQKKDAALSLELVKRLVRMTEPEFSKSERERLSRLIDRVSPTSPPDATAERWVHWYQTEYPTEAKQLQDVDGVDFARWQVRLENVTWNDGDVARGKMFFEKTGCQSCHGTARALGPDLAGVGKRFSRADLFRAIVQPSRDIPERYRSTRMVTEDGQTLHGIVIYEAVDGGILQLPNLETVRYQPSELLDRSGSKISLMPAGQLDKAADRDLADLYAFLASL